MTTVNSTVQWLESSLQSPPRFRITFESSQSKTSVIFLSFCSSLTLASLLASLLAWRLLRKARTWAWTAYLFHSMNFSDRKGSCWQRKKENLFV
jgi:hypothetical protein